MKVILFVCLFFASSFASAQSLTDLASTHSIYPDEVTGKEVKAMPDPCWTRVDDPNLFPDECVVSVNECAPLNCDSCVVVQFKYHGTCDLDSVQLETNNTCFAACTAVIDVTADIWDPTRQTCSEEPLVVKKTTTGQSLQNGKDLLIRLCGPASSFPITLHIRAFDCGQPCDGEFTI